MRCRPARAGPALRRCSQLPWQAGAQPTRRCPHARCLCTHPAAGTHRAHAGRAPSPRPQEEERERRMDFIPDESAINTDAIEVDKDTMEMLRGMDMAGLPGITVQQVGRPGGDFQKPGGFQQRPPRP